MFKSSYTQAEIDEIVVNITPRRGWDFSQMNVERQVVPWRYEDIVALYLNKNDCVLDIGTGGGENFLKLSKLFKRGLGIDNDDEMVAVANENAKDVDNVSFYQDNQYLEKIEEKFDVILNRHAPFHLEKIRDHLKDKGYFITQQVGYKNMLNIKKVLNGERTTPVISKEMIEKSGVEVIAFMEYNVEYVVRDVESLVFWLQALDLLHADISGKETIQRVDTFNAIIKDSLNERGFITNEHRYLVVAQKL